MPLSTRHWPPKSSFGLTTHVISTQNAGIKDGMAMREKKNQLNGIRTWKSLISMILIEYAGHRVSMNSSGSDGNSCCFDLFLWVSVLLVHNMHEETKMNSCSLCHVDVKLYCSHCWSLHTHTRAHTPSMVCHIVFLLSVLRTSDFCIGYKCN